MARRRTIQRKIRNSVRRSPLARAVREGAREEIDRDVEIIRRKASASLHKAQRKFMTAEKKVQRYIKSHPEKATLIAAGIGAAIGAAMSSALRKGKRTVKRLRR